MLAGPSGAGKSRLAARLHRAHGWPIVRLDDFYLPGDDPRLPVSAELGMVDWDDPSSWDAAAAVEALSSLCASGSVHVPVYDLATSSVVGEVVVSCGSDEVVVCEGIFAAEVISELERRGLLHSAWCVRHMPVVTFVRRLLRDLRERRKAPSVLVRRGWALMRAERSVVARQEALGARPARPHEVERALSGGSTARNS